MWEFRRAGIAFVWPGTLGVVLVGLGGTPARAEPTPAQKAAATVLFREARTLAEKGDTAAACRRFEESQRLDPLPGTLLNMAVCHEKEGRTATAWVEFRDAEALARRDDRADRMALAAEHEKALEPRLRRIQITVATGADVPGLAILLDGAELPKPAWSSPLPVDPGEHVLDVSAPNRVTRTSHVSVPAEGETKTVTVEALEAVPAPSAAMPAPAPAPPPLVPPPPAPVPAATAVAPPEPPPAGLSEGLGGRRELALVLGSASVLGLAAGTYFGLDAIAKHNDSNGQCPTTTTCSAAGLGAERDAGRSADVATVAFGASIAVLGAAVYLWVTGGGEHASPAAAPAVHPVVGVGRNGSSVGVGGAF
ncbi:MAG TPA: hypothetical protein VGI39_19215 [Polyangiaceae bacterium]|jgi:hypothetical protein